MTSPHGSSPATSSSADCLVVGRSAYWIASEADEVLFPWRVLVGDAVFAVDLLRSLPVERLLDHVDHAPAAAMAIVRRALLDIT